jgi:hypothetical protein
MKFPPCLVGVKIAEEERTKFRIWLPLFILWPLLLALVLLALIVALFVDGVLVIAGQKHGYSRLVVGGLEVLGASRGVEVSVRDKHHTVAVTVN